MARIRTIKPEFPQSETIGKLSRDARLLFIQLWTIADDAGRTRAASRMLASLLYPYDDDAPALIEGWLVELEANDCIVRYEAAGSKYLEVSNWLKHQKIDKPSASKIPPFDDNSRSLAKPREASTTDLGPRTMDLGKDHSSSTVRDALEIECREICGTEPVIVDGNFQPIAELLTEDGITPDDVRAGMRAAMAERSFRPRSWSQLSGWVRRAAKDRLALLEKPQTARAPPAGKPDMYAALEESKRILAARQAAREATQ